MIIMDTDKIKQVIDSGETQEVEFKESFHSSQKISELMCGFANTYGGVIILGVTKKKEVIGVSGNLDEIQQRFHLLHKQFHRRFYHLLKFTKSILKSNCYNHPASNR